MTKEEAIKVLDQVRQWTDYPKEAFTMAIDALSKPSLPSDLDKAARKSAVAPFNFELDEEHIYEYPYLPIAEQKFKEGAEWMAGQGYTTEEKVDRTPLNGPPGICLNLHEYDGFKLGDKVIVQIRKKD